MKVLFLTHFFPPEIGAPQTRIAETAKDLASRGHEVEVLTTFPHYPSGRLPEGYRLSWSQGDTVDGTPVVRTWTLVAPNRGIVRRTLDHLLFAVTARLAAGRLRSRPDVISVDMHPVYLCLTARSLAQRWGVPYVVNVGDLHPEMAADMGVFRNPLLYRFMYWLSQLAFKDASLLLPLTRGIGSMLLRRGLPEGRIHVLHYGANVELFDNPKAWDPLPAEMSAALEGRTVVSYIGTHGLSQALETILAAARLVADRDPQVLFVLVGGGSERTRLIALAEELKLQNVRFFDPIPRAAVPSLYARSFASIVSLRDIPTFRVGAMPSKVFEIMASATPVIVCAAGECPELVAEAEAGVCVSPERPELLAGAISDLLSDPAIAREMGERGRAYVLANFSRQRQSAEFERLLQRTLDSAPAGGAVAGGRGPR